MKNSEQTIYGIRPVMEAIKAGETIDKVLLQKGIGGDTFKELRQLLLDRQIPFQFVPEEKINRITRKNHQGVVCIISPIPFCHVDQVVPNIFERGENPFLLILDRITDVRNLGAIIRTAECAGVHAVILPSRGSAQINDDTVRTSAGAIFNIPVCREDNLKETVRYLKDSGIQVVSCTEKATIGYAEIDYHGPTAVIVGSEEDGISQEYIRLSDKIAGIPLKGETASLNVSVAAGVILFEVNRQRG